MRNFISEDDIEQAILTKLKAEPFNMIFSFVMLILAKEMI